MDKYISKILLEPLETEAAPASKAATRAARPSKDCSMIEILFVIDATDCVRGRSMGNEANASKWTSNWAIFVKHDFEFFLHGTDGSNRLSGRSRKGLQ